ncbi:hypothetical protein AADZ84_17030 [Colwelliaceae bacterium MEBiC 14330]
MHWHLNNMQSYEAYRLLEAEHDSYVIGSGIFNGKKTLFALLIDNVSAKLKHQLDNYALRDLMFSPQFYQKLNTLISRKGLG